MLALDPKVVTGRSVVDTDVGLVSAKPRFAIVIAVYETSMVALPMYTSNGNGLVGKSSVYKRTALNVVDPSS